METLIGAGRRDDPRDLPKLPLRDGNLSATIYEHPDGLSSETSSKGWKPLKGDEGTRFIYLPKLPLRDGNIDSFLKPIFPNHFRNFLRGMETQGAALDLAGGRSLPKLPLRDGNRS